jgi:glycosyltransferase involved in cell wall biosynthesis
MRILFLNYEYPPLGGGAANATEYILKEFSKTPDLEVELVTSSIDGRYRRETLGERIVIHRLPIGKKAGNLHFQSQADLLAYSWRAYGFARRLLRERRFDVVHAFFAVPCGVLAWVLHKEFRVPYVVSLRGADVPGYSERFRWLYGLLRPLVRVVWRNAAEVIANSEGLRQLALETAPKQPISVIYNGVDTLQFSPADRQERAGDGVLRLLCVSRLTPRKGVGYLLEAVAMLKERYGGGKVRLSIAGEGDEKAALMRKAEELGIQDSVEFAGCVAHDDLPAMYRKADLFVLPSLNEGMSNTVLEAIASGLAVLATDTGGTKELVRDGENGFLVAMKDARDIADKAALFLERPELVRTMGEKSRQTAESMGWTQVAGAYKEAYGHACTHTKQ